MSNRRDLVDEAWEIVKAKVNDGTASGGDRACYYILGTSAFRLLPGPWNAETQAVAEHLQESLAFTIVMHEKSPKACERCGVTFKLVQQCENEDCPADRDDD